MTRGTRLSVLVLVVVVAAWGLWAYAVMRGEEAYAVALYRRPPATTDVYDGHRVEVASVHASVASLEGLLPPDFQFRVSIIATVDGVAARSGSTDIVFSGQPFSGERLIGTSPVVWR
jgi:hypothetical protein